MWWRTNGAISHRRSKYLIRQIIWIDKTIDKAIDKAIDNLFSPWRSVDVGVDLDLDMDMDIDVDVDVDIRILPYRISRIPY